MEANEPFIGREKMRKFLLDEIFLSDEWRPKFCPIVAPRGFGKTELMRAVVRDFEARRPQNTFHFFTDLEPGDTYVSFWSRLIPVIIETVDVETLAPGSEEKKGEMDDYARRILRDVVAFFKLAIPKKVEEEGFREALQRARKQLFEAYSILGVRIIITVDGFERARFLDPDIYESLVSLEIGTYVMRRHQVSVITLSRVWIHSEREEDEWESWIAPFYLGGFSNEELDLYFNSYRDLSCGIPDQDTQMRILYLCGRSPELLMRMRHNLAGGKHINDLDLLALFDTDARYFEHVCHNLFFSMSHLPADEWEFETLADLFWRQLIQPDRESISHAAKSLARLRQHGFVTRELADGNLFERLGLPIPPGVKRTRSNYIYEPIFPFLLDFVRSRQGNS